MQSMKKILVTGASGMIASRVVDLMSKQFDVVSTDEKTLDISNKKTVDKYFEDNHDFDAIINFAAYTNVDGAEKEQGDKNGLVWKINVEGSKNLAEVAKKHNIFLVHISTTFVFPGDKDNPGPYDEDTKLPNVQDGLGWYAWTKNRAELEVSSIEPRVSIIRYAYPFRAVRYDQKLDWARNLLKLYNEHKLYPLFNDQTQDLIFVDDLVAPLTKIIENKLSGIFHITSSDTATPYESGKYLLEKYTGKPIKIQKGSIVEFMKAPGRTPRPQFGGLKTEKTQKKLGIKFRTWKEMVDEFISQIEKD